LSMSDGPQVGDVVEAEVFKITGFGAFVKFAQNKGLIHISQVSDNYVKDINEYLKVGDKIKARIINVSGDGKIDLSLKSQAPEAAATKKQDFKFSDFEHKLKSFLKKSQEKQADLRKNIEAKQIKKRHR